VAVLSFAYLIEALTGIVWIVDRTIFLTIYYQLLANLLVRVDRHVYKPQLEIE
jgi:hypothetical protein